MYYRSVFGAIRFPHYRSHRQTPLALEGLGWLWKFACQGGRERKAQATLHQVAGKLKFVLPLQLSSDYQIRTHSLFPDMQSAATYVLESFAAHALHGASVLKSTWIRASAMSKLREETRASGA